MERDAARTPLTVSVNLSAVQLDQGNLPELVAGALADSGLPARPAWSSS